MKEIIKKTEKERILEAKGQRMVAKLSELERYYFYFACDKCNVAFFRDDVVEKDSEGYHCPLMVGIFIKRKCDNHMYGGSEENLNKYYTIKP